VTLGYRRADVPGPLDAFGFVVPRAAPPLLAVHVLEREVSGPRARGLPAAPVLVGGALNEGILQSDDGALVATTRDELRQALGVTAEPVLTRLVRGPSDAAIYVGHGARIETIERGAAALPGLQLAGGAYRGVGDRRLRAIGRAAAERALGGRLGGRRDLDRPEPAQLLDSLPGVTEHLARPRACALRRDRAPGRGASPVGGRREGYGRDAHGAAPGWSMRETPGARPGEGARRPPRAMRTWRREPVPR